MQQFVECLYNLAFRNPVGKVIAGIASTVLIRSAAATEPGTEAVIAAIPFHELAGNYFIFVRLAALGGASAAIINWIKPKRCNHEMFAVANNVHFCHSLALVMIPFVKKPMISGTFLIAGTSLFCGSLYLRALTGNKCYKRYASMGHMIMLLGWLTILTHTE